MLVRILLGPDLPDDDSRAGRFGQRVGWVEDGASQNGRGEGRERQPARQRGDVPPPELRRIRLGSLRLARRAPSIQLAGVGIDASSITRVAPNRQRCFQLPAARRAGVPIEMSGDFLPALQRDLAGDSFGGNLHTFVGHIRTSWPVATDDHTPSHQADQSTKADIGADDLFCLGR